MNRRSRPRPVFSVWAWLVLAPYLLTALGGVDGASTAHEWLTGAFISVTVHLVLLGVYLGLGAIEVAIAARPVARWTVVAAAFVAIAIARPLFLSGLQHLAGIDLVASFYPARMLLNLFVLAIGSLLMYGLIEVVRRNLDSRRRLLAVLGQLESQAARVEALADGVADDFQREVRGPVVDALGGLVVRDLPPRELSDELRWIAHAVVRPLSHRASRAELEEALDGVRIDPEPPLASREVPVRGLLQPSRIRAAPAWLSTLVCMLLLLPAEMNAQQGTGTTAMLMAFGTAVSLVGSLVIQFTPLPRAPGWAIAQLALEEVAAGALVIWALLGPIPLSPIVIYYLIYGTLGYATVAVVLSVIGSGLRELVGHQERTAAAVAAAEQRAFRARQRLAAESRATGRLLHTEVQGDLIATSLQLRLGTAGEDPLGRLIERVDRILADPVASDGDEPASAAAIRDGFRASLDAWSLSLDLAIDVDPMALDRLAEQPRAAAVAHDALTEGLTNAVRHGRGERASVAIRFVPDEESAIEVAVANPGRIAAVAGAGIGLQDLDARAREVSLSQVGGEVVLRVVV